jgi:hypothetical protein
LIGLSARREAVAEIEDERSAGTYGNALDVERRRDLDEIEAEDPGMPGNPPQAACTSRESSPPGFVGAVPGRLRLVDAVDVDRDIDRIGAGVVAITG